MCVRLRRTAVEIHAHKLHMGTSLQTSDEQIEEKGKVFPCGKPQVGKNII